MIMSKIYCNIDLEEMMKARIHLGHKTRKWNLRWHLERQI